MNVTALISALAALGFSADTRVTVGNGANFATRFTAAANAVSARGGGVVYVPYDSQPYKVEKEILLDSLTNVVLMFDPGVVLKLPDPVTFNCTFNGTAIVAAAPTDVNNITSWDFYNRFYVGSTALAHGNYIVSNVGFPDSSHFTVAHSTDPTSYPLMLNGSAPMTFYPAWNILRRRNCTNVGILCPGGTVVFDGNSTNQSSISITSDEQDALRNCLRTEGGTGHFVDGLLTRNAYFHGEIGVPITGTEGVDTFTIKNVGLGSPNGVVTNIATTVDSYTATVTPMLTGIASGMMISGNGVGLKPNTLITGVTHNSGANTSTVTLSKPAIATATLTDGGIGKTYVVDRIYIGRYKAMNHGFRGIHYHGDKFTIVRDFTAIHIELENNGVISRTNVPGQYRVNSGMFVGYENCHRYHIETVTIKNETGYGIVFAGRNLQDIQAKNFHIGSVVAKDTYYAVALYNGMKNVNIGSIIATSSTGPINVSGCTLISLGSGLEYKTTAPSTILQTANGLNTAMTTPAIIGTIQLPANFDMNLVRVGSLVQVANLQVDDTSNSAGLAYYNYSSGTIQWISKRLYVLAVNAAAKTIQVYQDGGPTNWLWSGADAGATRDIVIYNGYAALYLGGDYTKTNQVTENIQIGQLTVDSIMAGLVMSKASFTVTASLNGTLMTVTDSKLAIGQTVSGTGIPDGTVITDTNTAGTTWTLSNSTTTGSGITITVGPYTVRTLKINNVILDGLTRGLTFYNVDDLYLGSVTAKNTCDNYYPSSGLSRNDSVSLAIDFAYCRNIYAANLTLTSQKNGQNGLITRSNGAELQFSKMVVDAKFGKVALQNGNLSSGALNFSPSGNCGYITFNDVRTLGNAKLTPTMPNATCSIQRPVQNSNGIANLTSTGVATFTIAHGLSTTPASFNVTAGSVAAATPFFATADTTNITVTYTTAPTNTASVVLNWTATL